MMSRTFVDESNMSRTNSQNHVLFTPRREPSTASLRNHNTLLQQISYCSPLTPPTIERCPPSISSSVEELESTKRSLLDDIERLLQLRYNITHGSHHTDTHTHSKQNHDNDSPLLSESSFIALSDEQWNETSAYHTPITSSARHKLQLPPSTVRSSDHNADDIDDAEIHSETSYIFSDKENIDELQQNNDSFTQATASSLTKSDHYDRTLQDDHNLSALTSSSLSPIPQSTLLTSSTLREVTNMTTTYRVMTEHAAAKLAHLYLPNAGKS